MDSTLIDYSDDDHGWVEKFSDWRKMYEQVNSMQELRKLTKRLKDEDGRWGPILYFHNKIKNVLQPKATPNMPTPAEARANRILYIQDSTGRRHARKWK